MSEEERRTQELVRAQSGYYDYLSSKDRALKISKSQKGKIGTSLGKKWYNDGIKEYYSDVVPVGYNPGRLITNTSKIGLCWFNNGKENRQFRIGFEPKGYARGRINKK